MSKFHFLNVKQGDCRIIQHEGSRVSMIDICNGNAARKDKPARLIESLLASHGPTAPGDFGMCQRPTHPLDYLDELGIKQIWRFILSHPDMDHMDGLKALFDSVSVPNFWDSGARREKPDFDCFNGYCEEDWDQYEAILAGKVSDLTVLQKQHGARFDYANKPENGHDGLYILAPNPALVEEASEKCNRASYMILYSSPGGKILIPGDAEDSTWEFVLANYANDVRDCSILVAPHHGRHSDMDVSYLETVNPKLVLMGCACSNDLAYDAFREYWTITNNQAGNVVAECDSEGMNIFVENETFAKACEVDVAIRNNQGYVFLGRI
jgi:competence protein ComEC